MRSWESPRERRERIARRRLICIAVPAGALLCWSVLYLLTMSVTGQLPF